MGNQFFSSQWSVIVVLLFSLLCSGECVTAVGEKDKQAAKALKNAVKDEHSQVLVYKQDFAEAINEFENIEQMYPGTKASKKAAIDIKKLKKLRYEIVAKVMQNLRKQAAPYIKKGELGKAADLYRNYTGKVVNDTETVRNKIADDLSKEAYSRLSSEEKKKLRIKKEETDRLLYAELLGESAMVSGKNFSEAIDKYENLEQHFPELKNNSKVKDAVEKLKIARANAVFSTLAVMRKESAKHLKNKQAKDARDVYRKYLK